MKTATLRMLVISACLLGIQTMMPWAAFARIWFVDNNPGNNPDFTSVQAAHNAASPGDSLYVAGSSQSYAIATITKQLFIFGPGYFLGENPDTQAEPLSAIILGLTFNAGSDGSLVTGCFMQGAITVNTSDITIKRNRFSVNNVHINIASNLANVVIIQNFMDDAINATGINVSSNSQNILIANNYIQRHAVAQVIISDATASLIVKNNVLNNTLTIHNSTFYDNILRGGAFNGTNNDIRNNIGNSTQFGTGNGNQENVDMNTVFVGTGSTDGQWQLAQGSPAIGAGVTGGHIGMYGGTDPYVLSGIPSIPAIYFFDASVQGSATSGLPVQMKVKSRN